MANELKDALDQLKTDVDAISTTQRVQLGPILTALPEADQSNCVVSITLRAGYPDNDTYTATSEHHQIELRFYWLLTPPNVEIVEQNVATMWDLVMTKFFGGDADRNLTEKCTLALVGGTETPRPYQCGYEVISNKLHRVLIVPVEIILDTHSV